MSYIFMRTNVCVCVCVFCGLGSINHVNHCYFFFFGQGQGQAGYSSTRVEWMFFSATSGFETRHCGGEWGGEGGVC